MVEMKESNAPMPDAIATSSSRAFWSRGSEGAAEGRTEKPNATGRQKGRKEFVLGRKLRATGRDYPNSFAIVRGLVV
jgi:hypothetical protein